MDTIVEYINKIKNEVESLKQETANACRNEVLFAFRGESRDYGRTKLMPSIFRNPESVKKEVHLLNLLCDYGISKANDTNIEKAMESQHYLAISRMLDISFNLLVALYFACKSNKDDDGYVYIFAFPEYYSPHSKYIEDFYENILNVNQETKYYYKNFKVVSHAFSNERMIAQNGGFIFFPGRSFSEINSCYYKQVTIEKKDKQEILDSMRLLFAIDEYKIFPEKEKIAEAVKNKFYRTEGFNYKISIEDDIMLYLNHLYYEVDIMQKRKESIKNILRFLRKEKRDLINYIKEITTLKEKEKQQLYEIIANNFNIIEMKVGNTYGIY